MKKNYSLFIFKQFCFLFVGILLISIPTLNASSINSQITTLSNTIIDNRVQIKLIESHIENITQNYQIKLKSLQNKYKEFATSIAILYKIKTTPKEILLVENLSKEQTLNTFVVTNYWIKNATNTIHKLYLELEYIKSNIKELNQAKHKLHNLNIELLTNQKHLNNLLLKNNLTTLNIEEINKIRSILKYNSTIASYNLKLFAKIDNPILTKIDQDKNNEFIKKNKGKMLWPTAGKIYTNYQSNKYYDLTYYGIVLHNNCNKHIISPADGEIIFCDALEKYNNIIMIKHAPSYISIISGSFNFNVRLSQKIKKGELIATANNDDSQIYFELNYLSTPINPSDWLLSFNERNNNEN